MSELVEGLGTAAEGNLFARALDPASGARPRDPHQPDNCLNCGAGLIGAYCHACGQSGHVHRTIGGFMHDLLHGALHFEGKLWRTLPMLVFRPGALTRRYVEGQRARFVSPMALFLFSVFLMFAVFQMIGLTTPTDIRGPSLAQAMSDVRAEAVVERDAAQEALAATPEEDPRREVAQQRLADAEAALEGIAQIRTLEFGTGEGGSDFSTSEFMVGWLDSELAQKWRNDPALMLYKLQSNSYKFSWLLIPISIPFVWLLFLWRRQFRGYDHAIFVTYSMSFMTLLFIAISLLMTAGVPAATLGLAAMLIPPVHIYKQLRGAYSLRRFSAFWRLMALSAFIWIIAILYLQVLVALGAY